MLRKHPAQSIQVDGDAFTLVGTEPEYPRFALSDIGEVTFFKRDELTTDLICCEIVVRVAQGAQTWFLHEEVSGFDDLVGLLERLPEFDRNWRSRVVLPPFAENRTVAYRKSR